MIERGEQKPIRFEIILIIAAFLVAGVFTPAGHDHTLPYRLLQQNIYGCAY